jgi:HD-GYP domain-containing protein (c-di-GMP phosphodiesterase class II)
MPIRRSMASVSISSSTDRLSLSRTLTALSYALDLTEGHPRGHTARSCLIGMRLAEVIGMPTPQRSDLFYALLLKDAGCSSNAPRVHQLFGGTDHLAKRAVWLRDWRKCAEQLSYALEVVEPDGTLVQRFRKFANLALLGPRGGKELFQIRCDRGAEIAQSIGFGPGVVEAVRTMDEHWDGWGYPAGLKGQAIPLVARIIGLAQVLEIFAEQRGPAAAVAVAAERSGRWFDPDLVRAARALEDDADFWASVYLTGDLPTGVAAVEPVEHVVTADAEGLDRISRAFAWVIDAKSAFTFSHSERMADMTWRIARQLGLPVDRADTMRRAALLHDIGKLAVPNRILDKPGKLTADEWDLVRAHPRFTFEILDRVPGLRDMAFEASLHHERLDGKGYYRGVPGDQLPLGARIMAVADVYDALLADRPYRPGMPIETVMSMLRQDAGTAFCAECVCAAEQVVASGTSSQDAA